MTTATLVHYDQIPYQSGPFRQTHPCQLSVLPILFGLSPPTIRTGRVLELGCASGGNLIPMAPCLPDAEFVGVDLSSRQIADGCAVVSRLGLKNVELRHASIMDVDESFGEFDFILCHGVFSWVPREVQDKILSIASANLAADGLCYVSYNVYPGWHLRGLVRDMMRYHVAGFEDPIDQIQQSRALLDFLNKSSAPGGAAYQQLLADEAKIISRHSDSYLFHEHLEDVNEPLYFHEFVDRAAAAGLAYMGDADFSTMLTDVFDADAVSLLRDVPLLRQEQYMDFLRNRTFRSSVICRAGRTFDRHVTADRLTPCHVALRDPVRLPGSTDGESEWEVSVGNDTLHVSQPCTKAAVRLLSESWPATVPVQELLSNVGRDRASDQAESSTKVSAEPIVLADLMSLFTRGLLRVWHDPPLVCAHPGDAPEATALARLQVQQSDVVTNQWHELVKLTDLPRAMLPLLDGTRNRSALADWLGTAIARGEFRIRRDTQPLVDVDAGTVDEVLDGTLRTLAGNGLLIA